jgi:hypothetical protein
MISVLLIAVAAALYFGLDKAKLASLAETFRSKLDAKTAVALSLVVLALALAPSWGTPEDNPSPDPVPGPFSLRGDFKGPTASEDACLVGCLLQELADEISWDGSQEKPDYKTGFQIDELRKIARRMRCRGESIGDRQPSARDKIASYLESHIGTDGGDLTPESRALWVSAFRDVGRAACDAAK